jgi:hypothetical protein
MFRVAVAAAVILAAMILVKDRSVLERTGLLSSCAAVAAPPGDVNFWEACRPGRLEGRPNLMRRSCQSMRVAGRVEYWRCPAPIGTETTS